MRMSNAFFPNQVELRSECSIIFTTADENICILMQYYKQFSVGILGIHCGLDAAKPITLFDWSHAFIFDFIHIYVRKLIYMAYIVGEKYKAKQTGSPFSYFPPLKINSLLFFLINWLT